MKMFQPMNQKILVKQDEVQEITAGGIYLAGGAEKKEPVFTVVRVSEDCEKITSKQIGLRVTIGKFTGHKFDIDGIVYMLAHENDVLGYFEE